MIKMNIKDLAQIMLFVEISTRLNILQEEIKKSCKKEVEV